MKKFEMPDFYFSGTITPEQQEFFDKYGIIQFKKFIDTTTVSLFLKETENVQKHLLSSDTKKVNGIPLKFGTDIDGSRLVQRIAFTWSRRSSMASRATIQSYRRSKPPPCVVFSCYHGRLSSKK
jgi:hypothetical protein